MIERIENTINTIDALIKEQLPESKYQFELFDLKTNTKHFRGYDEPFHWGSVYKLFVVAEIIKMSEEGLFQMDDEIILHKELYKNGNGIIKFMTHLNKLTYTDACKMVMAVSDNLCADELLNVVGLNRLNSLFEKAGCLHSKLSVNLDAMVKDLFLEIENNIGASYFQSSDYFKHFDNSLLELLENNHTTVTDINNCYNYIFSKYLSQNGRSILNSFLKLPNQHSRLSYYVTFSNYLLKGKTGTLAIGISNNENAAIINKSTNEIYGYFAISTKDNKKRYFPTNDTIGLIGLEIVKLYEQLETLD